MTDPVAGGSVSRPNDRLEQRVRRLEEDLRALARRDLSNVAVGLGGRFSVKNPSGTENVVFGGDPDDETGASKFRINDNQGLPMLSADAKAGYGLGNPCFPFVYSGFEDLNLSGATTAGTATMVGEGVNWQYNPAVMVVARIRFAVSSALTVRTFAKFISQTGNVVTTTEREEVYSGAVFSVKNHGFSALMAAADMKLQTKVQFFAYCPAGTPANVTVSLRYQQGFGCSKGYYDLVPAFQ